MKTKLATDLQDERIVNLVGKDIYFLHKPDEKKPNIYIEYEIIDEVYDDYQANKFKSIEYIIQVDIFSQIDYEAVEKAIKEVFIENGYKPNGGADLYEEKTRLFHKAMRFYYKKNI